MLRDYRPVFRRDLRKVDRKHRGTADRVEGILGEIDSTGVVPDRARQIPNLNGAPVYKLRVKADRNRGQDARLIFHYDGDSLVPLFIHTKADRRTVEHLAIRNALDDLDPTEA